MEQPKPRKDVSLELMRVIAAFFVIFNHTQAAGYRLFMHYQPAQAVYWLYLAVSVFCRFSVPLYFMISGALLLGREPGSLVTLWKKRLGPMLVTLFLVSAVYYLSGGGETPGIRDFLRRVYCHQIKYHLWFFYCYIAYLVSLPLLQQLARQLTDHWYRYLIVLFFFYRLISMTDYLVSAGTYQMESRMQPAWLLSEIVAYPCIGYFLRYRARFTPKRLGLLWALNLAAILFSCGMTWYACNISESFNERFTDTLAGLNAACIFVTVRLLLQKRPLGRRLERLICTAGGCTFGIYLLHLLVLESPWMDGLMGRFYSAGVNYMLSAFLGCFCVMVISGAGVFC